MSGVPMVGVPLLPSHTMTPRRREFTTLPLVWSADPRHPEAIETVNEFNLRAQGERRTLGCTGEIPYGIQNHIV